MMTSAIIQLGTLDCPSCLHKIEATIKALKGVDQEGSRGLYNSSKLKVVFDKQMIQLEALEQEIEKLGYDVLYSKVNRP